MPGVQLEPTWVVDVRNWWHDLVGPGLTEVWETVRKKAGTPGLLESSYGQMVRRFEVELNKLVHEASAFAADAGQSEWAPFAAAAMEVASKVNAQWKDPKATQPNNVSGVLNSVSTVVRGINVGVSAIGVAWAVASFAEVTHARKLLAQWHEHLEDGVPPSRRDQRRAHISGEEGSVFGGDLGYQVMHELYGDGGYDVDGGYEVDGGYDVDIEDFDDDDGYDDDAGGYDHDGFDDGDGREGDDGHDDDDGHDMVSGGVMQAMRAQGWSEDDIEEQSVQERMAKRKRRRDSQFSRKGRSRGGRRRGPIRRLIRRMRR